MPPGPISAVLADNLRKHAERRGIAVSVLADRAGVSRRQMFGVLSGERDATLGWIEKVAQILEIEVAVLLERSPSATNS